MIILVPAFRTTPPMTQEHRLELLRAKRAEVARIRSRTGMIHPRECGVCGTVYDSAEFGHCPYHHFNVN